MIKNRIYAFLVILSGVLWSTSCIFVDLLGRWGFNSFQCSAIRILTSAIILNAMLIIKGKGFKYYKVSLGSYVIAAISGICSVFAMCVLYYACLTMTSAATAAILIYTAPLFVMIMSLIFFHERLTFNKISAFIIAIVGCALASGVVGEAVVSVKGVILGVLAGFAYSLYGILTSFYMKKNTEPLAFTAQSFIFASIGALCIANPVEIVKKAVELPRTWLVFAVFVLFALLTSVLPFFLYSKGVSGVSASTASILAFSEPLMAAVLGVTILGQSLDIFGIIGIVLVVTAIVVLNLPPLKRKKTY